jgi:LuxR family maltose regulon positive regulatory protein
MDMPTCTCARCSRPGKPLTQREIEVLGLLAKGLTLEYMAQLLYLSLNTVKTHVRMVYLKLGAHNRVQAVRRGRQQNLLMIKET